MLSKKLRLQEGVTIVALNAPADYKKKLGALPKEVTITEKIGKSVNFIQLFVKDKAQLENEIVKVTKALAPGGLLWITYPKGSSGIQTDLTRDKGWECLKGIEMEWVSLISFDDNWSAFLMRNNPPKKQSSASKEYHATQNEYADSKTKTVIVPEDLQKALDKNKKSATFYTALSFTGKKEYVMWVVGAKREETRKERITKTIDKLAAGKKTPTEK